MLMRAVHAIALEDLSLQDEVALLAIVVVDGGPLSAGCGAYRRTFNNNAGPPRAADA